MTVFRWPERISPIMLKYFGGEIKGVFFSVGAENNINIKYPDNFPRNANLSVFLWRAAPFEPI